MADTRTRMTQAIEKRHLTLREAADWYGVSERTLRRRIAEGKLPAFRVGPRSIRVTAEDVAALAQPIPTANLAG
jgi:excisionase family DNA binding protein